MANYDFTLNITKPKRYLYSGSLCSSCVFVRLYGCVVVCVLRVQLPLCSSGREKPGGCVAEEVVKDKEDLTQYGFGTFGCRRQPRLLLSAEAQPSSFRPFRESFITLLEEGRMVDRHILVERRAFSFGTPATDEHSRGDVFAQRRCFWMELG